MRKKTFHLLAAIVVVAAPLLAQDAPQQAVDLPSTSLTAFEKMLERGMSNATYRERLEQRRAELLAERAAQDDTKLSAINEVAEERAAVLFLSMMRRQNLDMIRRGERSLGIPLTPEETAALTAEGVFPAQPQFPTDGTTP